MTVERPKEADIAFEKLDDDGKMRKLLWHLDHPLGYPVPAPWVRWLLAKLQEQ